MAGLKQIGIDVDVHRVIEQARRTFSESENDILRRIILPVASKGRAPERALGGPRLPDPGGHPTRSRGAWSVEFQGERIAAANLKDAYRILLLTLHQSFPDFLDRFSQEKARSRRFVAHSPAALYSASPHLAKDHARSLIDDWYFDTNLSCAQVSQRARTAARLCDLLYGKDVRILENFREI